MPRGSIISLLVRILSSLFSLLTSAIGPSFHLELVHCWQQMHVQLWRTIDLVRVKVLLLLLYLLRNRSFSSITVTTPQHLVSLNEKVFLPRASGSRFIRERIPGISRICCCLLDVIYVAIYVFCGKMDTYYRSRTCCVTLPNWIRRKQRDGQCFCIHTVQFKPASAAVLFTVMLSCQSRVWMLPA